MSWIVKKIQSHQVVALLVAAYASGGVPAQVVAQNVACPVPQGGVGIGTYATVSQFKDLHVSAGDRVLLGKSLSEGLAGFDVFAGQWKVIDGVLQQSSLDAKGMNAFTGDKSWTDYVVSVKARKVTGKEGFSLGFRAKDDRNFACLNVGGWNNTKAQFGITINGTFSDIGDSTPIKVEEDRWYDIQVDVHGDQATGFVNGQRVAFAKLMAPPPKAPAAQQRGNARDPRGGGRDNASVPAPVAESVIEPPSVWSKLILIGGTLVITGLVTAGVMWIRSRLGTNSHQQL